MIIIMATTKRNNAIVITCEKWKKITGDLHIFLGY